MTTPPPLPPADVAVAHTLMNCLLRELPEVQQQSTIADDRLHVRLPHAGSLLRIEIRRTSLLGAHRFTGPVEENTDGSWQPIDGLRLAAHIHAELLALTGTPNPEFLDQVASSRRGVASALTAPRPIATGDRTADYLASEHSLVYGHRFHPTPKARDDDADAWRAYAPENAATFPLRMLAVREELVRQEQARPGAADPLDALGSAPDGYLLLPTHPWQHRMLEDHPGLQEALRRRDVLDLGPGPRFSPTASVRTVYDGTTFLKFSLNIRITNCVRKNADYELAGAVALTRLLDPAFADLAERFPDSSVLREPAYRTLAVPGSDGQPDRSLVEGFGVIVREGLGARQQPGTTALLAAAVADEYPTGPGHLSRILAGADQDADQDASQDKALRWWGRYLRLLVPPVLAAYLDHGIVLEPHLQNVVVCIDDRGNPAQVLFRDLEGTKLLAEHHGAALAELPPHVADPLVHDADRGWDRVVYCLLVNHVAEMLAALADLYPGDRYLDSDIEAALWEEVGCALTEFADKHRQSARLEALLRGAPWPAKKNLFTRWGRAADREAGYVRLRSPLVALAPCGRGA